MRRGKVVKALTPMARPFCDRQVRGLRDSANREDGIRGSLLHPLPRSPSSFTCGPHPSILLTGCLSMGTQEPTKWAFPAAMATPETWDPQPRSSEEAPSAPDKGQVCSAHTPTSMRGPRGSLFRQVKSIQEQIHPTKTTQLFISCEAKSFGPVRLFVTPWTVAYQAPPSMEFSRQENWSGLPFPSPGDLPNPGMEPTSLALAGRFFTTEPPGKPLIHIS